MNQEIMAMQKFILRRKLPKGRWENRAGWMLAAALSLVLLGAVVVGVRAMIAA
jgi:hypothetical protein